MRGRGRLFIPGLPSIPSPSSDFGRVILRRIEIKMADAGKDATSEEISARIDSILTPVGMESYPFKVKFFFVSYSLIMII